MENNDFQIIWKDAGSNIPPKSKDELNRILEEKATRTLNKFIAIIIASVSSSIGLITWLILTSINRQNDTAFLLNNAFIGIITICALIAGIRNWLKLQDNRFDMPLKQWLEERVSFLSNNKSRPLAKLYILLLPLLCIMIILSIHVYYEYQPFLEVIRNGESVAALVPGMTMAIIAAFFVNLRLRKFTAANLSYLRELLNRISSENQ